MSTHPPVLSCKQQVGSSAFFDLPDGAAEETRQRFGVSKVKSGALEIAALILLPIGGLILPVVGWFIGVILLWSSRVWTTAENLAGTLLFPGDSSSLGDRGWVRSGVRAVRA